jgi:hypothetical protein
VDTALEFDPDNVEALRLRALLLIANRDFYHGHRELIRYLERRPDDSDAAALASLSSGNHPETNQLAMADQLSRQGMPELGDVLALSAQDRLELYRRRIRNAYGLTLDANSLRMDTTGKVSLSLWMQRGVKDLEPLRGMSITHLTLNGTGIESLAPLVDMPLLSLHIGDCQNLKDLGPLHGTWDRCTA